MKYLWRFDWDCMWSYVEGLFIATEEEVGKMVDKELYLGEIAGKHSDVSGVFEMQDVTRYDLPEHIIDLLESMFGDTLCGINPLEFFDEDQCLNNEDEDEDDDDDL